jgi:hypothetical protein
MMVLKCDDFLFPTRKFSWFICAPDGVESVQTAHS